MYAIIPHSVARKQKTQKPINPKKVIDPYASTYTHGDPTTRPKIDLHHNKLHARFRNADARTKDHFPLSKCTIDIIFFLGGISGVLSTHPKQEVDEDEEELDELIAAGQTHFGFGGLLWWHWFGFFQSAVRKTAPV